MDYIVFLKLADHINVLIGLDISGEISMELLQIHEMRVVLFVLYSFN